jgi:DNA-binding transcriptional LysR family regulator
MFGLVRSATSLANPLAGSELVAFAIAVECGTLAAAADALELTQSAVTKRIHSLERRIGAPLLERGRFGVRPTALGRSIYPEVKRALDGLDALARLIAESQQQGTTELRLIASLTIGEFLLPGWLGEFRAERPDVHPQLEVLNSRRVLDAIRETQQVIGFVGRNDAMDGLRTLVLARDEIVVAVARSHPWARRRTLRARELGTQPYLTREASSGTRAVAQASLDRAGVRLEPSAQMASAQSLKRTLAGGGFTLISRLAIEDEQRHPRRDPGRRRRPRLGAVRGLSRSAGAQRFGPRVLALAAGARSAPNHHVASISSGAYPDLPSGPSASGVWR